MLVTIWVVSVDGDILLNSALFKYVRFVINMDMWRTTVLLRCFPLNRRLTFTQELPLTNLVLSSGVLIEPGAQWYKGGNVTIFLLSSNILLLVFSCWTHVLLGMCRYDYTSCRLVTHPFHSRLVVLWSPHAIPLYYRKGVFHILVFLLSQTLSPPLGSLVPSM